MANLTIRGARVNAISAYLAKSGQVCVEIEIHADWTDVVCQQLGWADSPEGFGKAPVGESLFASNMIMSPNKAGLKEHEIDLKLNKVEGFTYVPTKDKAGNSNGAELRFKAVSTADDALITMDDWMRSVQDTDKSACKITYSEETQQELGEGGTPAADAKPRGRKKAKAAGK